MEVGAVCGPRLQLALMARSIAIAARAAAAAASAILAVKGVSHDNSAKAYLQDGQSFKFIVAEARGQILPLV